MKYTDCLGVIELADRLVLPRLVSLVEKAVIEQMTEVSGGGGDLLWEALRLVQPCQVHNATQLSGWCLSYLAHNYNTVARRFPKVLRGLLPENQATLNLNRWPPIWYLKDYDLYQRMQTEHNKSEKQTNLKRARSVCVVTCRNKTELQQGPGRLSLLHQQVQEGIKLGEKTPSLHHRELNCHTSNCQILLCMNGSQLLILQLSTFKYFIYQS